MPGHNIVEIPAKKDIDGERAFEGTFAPTALREVMLEFDPKHMGPPVCLLKGENGATKEIHPAAQWGRKGYFIQKLADSTEVFSGLRVTMARGKSGRLVKVKLIARAPGAAPPAADAPAPSAVEGSPPPAPPTPSA